MREDTTDILSGNLPSLLALSHELKAPLALIRQHALMRHYYKDQATYDKALRRIELAAERSLRLVEGLTRTYRVSEFDSEPIHLGRLCEDIAHQIQPLYTEAQQTIQLDIPRQPVLAVGNRDLLSSIVYGLCDNAFHYASDQPVLLKVAKRGDTARLSVIDHGPGMTKKEQRAVIEKVGKSPQSMSMRPGSSGLGLYIAGRFAEAMDGVLGVSQLRQGQSFFVELPRSRQLSLLRI